MTKYEAKPEWAMSRRQRDIQMQKMNGVSPRRRRRWPWFAVAAAMVIGSYFANELGAFDPFKARVTQARADREAAASDAEAVLADSVEGAMQLAEFEVYRIAPANLRESLRVTGSLAPARQLHVSAEVSARIERIDVRAGDSVRTGDLLVKFDVESLSGQLEQQRSTVEATRAQLALAKADLERTESLVERELSPASALERARSSVSQLVSTLAAQETLVRNAELNIEHATILAPFDGVISERRVDPGQFVGAGTGLVSIVDLAFLEFIATAPVSRSASIESGQTVELTVEGFGNRVFEGQVERISPITVEGTRMLPVYVGLANPDSLLRGGMFASGELVLEVANDVISVPVSAVREDVQGSFVLAISDGIAERRAVEVKRRWNGGRVIEIGQGLRAGDVIVAEPMPELRAGTPVELLEF